MKKMAKTGGKMQCSPKEPMCACYKEKANLKKSFDMGWSIVKAPMYGGDECVHCEETIGGKSGNEAYECPNTGNAFCKGCYKHRKNYR